MSESASAPDPPPVVFDPARLDALRRTGLLDSAAEEAFDRLTRLCARILQVPIVLVSLVDRDRQYFKSFIGLAEPWASKRETPLTHSFCQHVVASGQPLLIEDARTDALVCDNLAIPDLGVIAYAGVPLTVTGGPVIGSLCAIDTRPRTWTDDEIGILHDLAASVMTEIDLRLAVREAERHAADLRRSEERLRRTERALRAAYERDHHIAEVWQRSLLREPPEEAFPHLSVATFYDAALDEALVGGDFFDGFALEEGKVGLVVGDVSGKGLAAAIRTAEVKFALRAFLSEYPYPARALSRLNDFLCEALRYDDPEGESFVALSLAVIEPATGAALFASAGAEPPVVLRRTGEAEVIAVTGFPLGVYPREEFSAMESSLAPGDLLLMTTDGITEARKNNDFLGYDGFVRLALAARPRGGLRAIGQAILDSVRDWAGGSLGDDACLLLARRY